MHIIYGLKQNFQGKVFYDVFVFIQVSVKKLSAENCFLVSLSERVLPFRLTSRNQIELIEFLYLNQKGINVTGTYAHYIWLLPALIVDYSYEMFFHVPLSVEEI